MIHPLLLAQDLTPGLTWRVERTVRLLNEEAQIDKRTVESIEFRVKAVRQDGYDLQIGDRTLAFGPNGQPRKGNLEPEDKLAARIERIQWTLLERRRGLAWSRKWSAGPVLPDGTVRVEPTPSGSWQVQYQEGEDLTLKGLAKCDPNLPRLVEFSATIDRFDAGLSAPVKVTVRQD
jgi:hypothetical protein